MPCPPRRGEHVGGAVDVDRAVLLPRADHADLGREVDRRRRIRPPRRRRRRRRARRRAPRPRRRSPLAGLRRPVRRWKHTTESPRRASARRRPRPIRLDAPVTSTLIDDRLASADRRSLRRPGATAGQHAAAQRPAQCGRSWRCGGCRPADARTFSTAATGRSTSARTAVGRVGDREARRPTPDPRATTTSCWTPTGPTPTAARPSDRRARARPHARPGRA